MLVKKISSSFRAFFPALPLSHTIAVKKAAAVDVIMATHQSDRDVVYEQETIVRSAASGGGRKTTSNNTQNSTTNGGFTEGFQAGFTNHTNGYYSNEPSMGEYLKGFKKVATKCLKEYKDVAVDIGQSLLVLFMQHPALGILFLVTGLFIAVPIGLYLGFAVVSFVSIVVTALFIEGMVKLSID